MTAILEREEYIEQAYFFRVFRERLASIGGALSIDAAPGRGTELRVAIPLPMTPQGATS